MRIAGRAKGGYYPTPPDVVESIAQHLLIERSYSHTSRDYALLDPTAGTGEALDQLATLLRQRYTHASRRSYAFFPQLKTYGIELSSRRAREARKRLNALVHTDAREVSASGFGLLFLNPPYDVDESGRRLEEIFLEIFAEALVPKGVLVYLIPEPQLPKASPLLTAHFEELRVFRFPPDSYADFKQVVVFGLKRESPVPPAKEPLLATDEPLGHGRPDFRYPIPVTSAPQIREVALDPGALLEAARSSSAWSEFYATSETVEGGQNLNPLTPLGREHLALLAAAGVFNHLVIPTPAGPLLLKGRVERTVEELPPEEDGEVTRQTYIESYTSSLVAMNLKDLTLVEIA